MGLSAPIEAVTSCNYQQKMAQKMHQSSKKMAHPHLVGG